MKDKSGPVFNREEWRHEFAGLALTGYLIWDAIKNRPEARTEFKDVSKACVALADCLLAELGKGE
jgi:hypothetical protein